MADENENENEKEEKVKAKKRGRPRKKSPAETLKEKLSDKSIAEISAIIDQLPDDSLVQLYRLTAGKKAYITSYASSEVRDVPAFLDFIKNEYGGGTFHLSFMVGGRYAGHHSFTIEGFPKKQKRPEEEADIRFGGGMKVIDERLRQLEEENRRLKEQQRFEKLHSEISALREEITRKSGGGTIVEALGTLGPALCELVKAMMNRQNPLEKLLPEVIPKLLENPSTATFVDKALEYMNKQLSEDPVQKLNSLIELSQKISPSQPPMVSGNNPNDGSWGAILGNLIKQVAPNLAGLSQNQGQGQIPGGDAGNANANGLEGAGDSNPLAPFLTKFKSQLAQRIKPEYVADMILQLLETAQIWGFAEKFPEVQLFNSNPDEAIMMFLNRFSEISAAGTDGREYAESVVKAIKGRLGGYHESEASETIGGGVDDLGMAEGEKTA